MLQLSPWYCNTLNLTLGCVVQMLGWASPVLKIFQRLYTRWTLVKMIYGLATEEKLRASITNITNRFASVVEVVKSTEEHFGHCMMERL